MNGRRSIGGALLALSRPVVGTMALSVGGLLLFRGVVPFEFLKRSNDVVGNYLQTLGSIYAVLLAFVVFVVWTQFNDARANVRQGGERADGSVSHRTRSARAGARAGAGLGAGVRAGRDRQGVERDGVP